MDAAVFLIVGTLGLLALIYFGRYLFRDSRVSSQQFAFILAISFAAFLFTLIIASHRFEQRWIFLALLISIIKFGFGYPVLYLFHKYRSTQKH